VTWELNYCAKIPNRALAAAAGQTYLCFIIKLQDNMRMKYISVILYLEREYVQCGGCRVAADL
jgi:hypothetical protein